ncbi:MAG: carbamoyl-phosphate synthase large subunit [Actinobacteria bacterium]|nr:carbamoyl-phosphate synthase large subunit [Actinomycetota bacterium]MCL5887805.1 carbamoyl-phosphate synthase large subunit [Actinomycetota bacterium]
MPRRDDVKKVLIIGSGPIIIGQACEFDYSGTQACKALRSLGYEIVLVNSNPATIMTDPIMADATYIEPLNVETITQIIEKERPDALLPNLGGQTALNLSAELAQSGVLDRYNVKIIGISEDAIQRGEDRLIFKQTMDALGIDMPKSTVVTTVKDAELIAADLGYPVVVRPAFTMGGTGGGLAYNIEELRTIAARGIHASRVGQILIEESVLGWEELELEIIRDSTGKKITVCFIENVDPMGVHTGDSLCTAPMLTIEPAVQQRLQQHAYDIVDAVGVIGGTNVQLAHDPTTGRITVIEINPRTSRSSALASKATGLPIALISAMLACGLTLDEIPYWRDGTLDKYTPSGDYVVVKFARWAFEKFPGAIDELGTQMRAVGEVMSVGRNYKEALNKAVRSLEIGRHGLGFAKDFHERPLEELVDMLTHPSSERHFIMYEALRKGATVDRLHEKTFVKRWFIEQMLELVELETEILTFAGPKGLAGSGSRPAVLPDDLLERAKKDGFSDAYLAMLLGADEAAIRERRKTLGIAQGFQPLPVSGVEGRKDYYYSTYNAVDAVETSSRRKIMILGGGPNRIGQGIEFDYCCVHAAFAFKELGFETIMVNCNPETVSTDYDTCDRLYFEPLTLEDVLAIYEKEQPEGVIVQFGGQTPLNLAAQLEAAGIPILGTSPEAIDFAEDRERFRQMMGMLGIPMPAAGMAYALDEALSVARRIGYPLMVRPSYVLGGRGMEIVHDESMLLRYVESAAKITPDHPLLIDRFLENAIECEADAVCDGLFAYVPAVMQHIEYAGIHSGDSACVIPPVSISAENLALIQDYTRKMAVELNVVGLMNVQYAIAGDTLYVLEANPRASRTVPIVSKVCGVEMVKLAVRAMLGDGLSDASTVHKAFPHFGVKEAVFPFNMFHEVDPVLGPEMRSTGEVLGMGSSFGLAYHRSQEAAGAKLPTEGCVLITVAERDRELILPAAQEFVRLGFKIRSTEGTCGYLAEHGIAATVIRKLHQGRPNIEDAIKNGEIQLVINTPAGRISEYDDSYIRRAAIKYKVPYITTTAAAVAAVNGISARRASCDGVKSLQQYHAEMM